MRTWPAKTLLALAALLSACGGGGGSSPATQAPTPPPPARGSLVLAPSLVAGFSASALASAVNSAQSGTTSITGEPACGIQVYTLRYRTLGSQQEATEASAAVYVPSGSGAPCSGPRPLLLYAHATSFDKNFDMARLDKFKEAALVAAMYAAQGYLVVAPNYAGYAGSALSYHPYLDAGQQADDLVDALRAARSSWAALATADNGRLLLAGYSQGGHVAVATQRALQTRYAGEFTAAAVAAMSGPYALLQMGDAIFAGTPTRSATGFLPLLTGAAVHAGAAPYANPDEMYEAAYAAGIDSLLPSTTDLEQLVSGGRLPASALFAADSQPQLATYGFGAGNLVRSAYRAAVLADRAAQPCTSLAACAPGQALRRWLWRNDLRTHVPATPLMLCGGEGDPTVPWANALAAQAAYSAAGVPASRLVLLNVDDVPGLGSDYKTARSGFAAAKLALRLNALSRGESPAEAVAANYHAGLVPPFCLLAARDFLAQYAAP
ncbi:S9 family peptidase [Massilia sp. TS11]|uniref:alpha/beta hydrolase family protein n=1 Tax=Massilia sp. TS11 TaxID=2908003 RepID=UPI001EDC23F1|nr:lipase family protein [Massilia sp. TS11]MCG2586425.1 lipase family protein [Massilia sp. TS11]